MLLINSSAVLYLDISTSMQFIEWNISFGKNCKSTTQMKSSAFVYRWIFLITMFSIPICITGIHSSIKILSKIGWSYILFFLLGSVQFCAILSLFISLLTDEQIFKGTMSEVSAFRFNSNVTCITYIHIGRICIVENLKFIILFQICVYIEFCSTYWSCCCYTFDETKKFWYFFKQQSMFTIAIRSCYPYPRTNDFSRKTRRKHYWTRKRTDWSRKTRWTNDFSSKRRRRRNK